MFILPVADRHPQTVSQLSKSRLQKSNSNRNKSASKICLEDRKTLGNSSTTENYCSYLYWSHFQQKVHSVKLYSLKLQERKHKLFQSNVNSVQCFRMNTCRCLQGDKTNCLLVCGVEAVVTAVRCSRAWDNNPRGDRGALPSKGVRLEPPFFPSSPCCEYCFRRFWALRMVPGAKNTETESRGGGEGGGSEVQTAKKQKKKKKKKKES